MQNNIKTNERLITANRILVKVRWLYMIITVMTGVISKVTGLPNINFPLSKIVTLGLISLSFNILFTYFFYSYCDKHQNNRFINSISIMNLLLDHYMSIVVIYYAGGIISISFLYLLFSVIAAAFYGSFLLAIIVASHAAILYSALILSQYFRLIPYIPRYNNPFEYQLAYSFSPVATNLFTIVGTYFVISIFAGMMAKQIRHNENKLLKEKEKGETIIANLIDGLVFCEHDNITVVNLKARNLLEIGSRNVTGRKKDGAVSREFPILKQVLDISESNNMDIVPVGKPDMVYRVSSVEVSGVDGEEGRFWLIRDVSRERFVEKMKSEFITIAGHQLRTPLSAIKNALSLLSKGDYGKVTKKQESVLKQSYEYTDRLIKIMNDLLSVSSIEEGRYEYQYKEISAFDLLRDLSSEYSSEAVKKNINLKLNIKNELKPARLDLYKIKLALGGIIKNAIDYSRPDSLIDISAEYDNAEKKIVIEIHDEGIGIPGNQQDKIFTKFFRAENALRFQTEGNGLDLFVAKNIINNHGGVIWFESEQGRGTTFYIKLPLEPTSINKIDTTVA